MKHDQVNLLASILMCISEINSHLKNLLRCNSLKTIVFFNQVFLYMCEVIASILFFARNIFYFHILHEDKIDAMMKIKHSDNHLSCYLTLFQHVNFFDFLEY